MSPLNSVILVYLWCLLYVLNSSVRINYVYIFIEKQWMKNFIKNDAKIMKNDEKSLKKHIIFSENKHIHE